MKINFKGAIFDADGTLLNSMYVWDELGERFLRGLNIEPEKNLSEILSQMSLYESSLYLKNKYSLNMTLDEIFEGILKIIENFYLYEVELIKGVKNSLENLKQNNIPMVIATSGDKKLLRAALKRNEIEKYFEEIFTCDELNTTKREAKIFMACSKFLGLKPEDTAVFEDAEFAFETAKKAGFITFLVKEDFFVNENGFNNRRQ